jgi:hypothetical protein
VIILEKTVPGIYKDKRKEMALAARFSFLNASLDRFLFVSIGEEENGMPLSVASALARLGRDPWVEGPLLMRRTPLGRRPRRDRRFG